MIKEIEISFKSFIDIERKKNGEIKRIYFTEKNEKNICLALRQIGYGYSRTLLPSLFFFKNPTNSQLSRIKFWELKDAFNELFGSLDISLLPIDIKKDEIMNAYYKLRPLKRNGLLYHYLENNLSEGDHKILLKY